MTKTDKPLLENKQRRKISRFLSLVLRHKPEQIGLKLDANGWGDFDYVRKSLNLTPQELREVVETNDKQRFEISQDGLRIRAVQGHSVQIDLDLEAKEPPNLLYHGTVGKNLASIFKKGLLRGERHHVHLSGDKETARKVGGRRGQPLILTVYAQKMYQDGYKFYISKNGVWLVDHVPVTYLKLQ